MRVVRTSTKSWWGRHSSARGSKFVHVGELSHSWSPTLGNCPIVDIIWNRRHIKGNESPEKKTKQISARTLNPYNMIGRQCSRMFIKDIFGPFRSAMPETRSRFVLNFKKSGLVPAHGSFPLTSFCSGGNCGRNQCRVRPQWISKCLHIVSYSHPKSSTSSVANSSPPKALTKHHFHTLDYFNRLFGYFNSSLTCKALFLGVSYNINFIISRGECNWKRRSCTMITHQTHCKSASVKGGRGAGIIKGPFQGPSSGEEERKTS